MNDDFIHEVWSVGLIVLTILLLFLSLMVALVFFAPEAEARTRAVAKPIAGPQYALTGQAVADDVATQTWVLAITATDPVDIPAFIRVWRVRNGGICPVVSLPTFGNPLLHAAVPIPTDYFLSGDLVMLEHTPGVTLELTMYGSFRGEIVGGFTTSSSQPTTAPPLRVECGE